MRNKIIGGVWNNGIPWAFYSSDEFPSLDVVSAVFGACFSDDKLIVTREDGRSWSMIGGHIEPGETWQDTLLRECLEEGGITITNYSYIGYNQITTDGTVPNTHTGGYYPPVGYIPFFLCTTDQPLVDYSCHEIQERRLLSREELSILSDPKRKMAEYFFDLYEQKKI